MFNLQFASFTYPTEQWCNQAVISAIAKLNSCQTTNLKTANISSYTAVLSASLNFLASLNNGHMKNAHITLSTVLALQYAQFNINILPHLYLFLEV